MQDVKEAAPATANGSAIAAGSSIKGLSALNLVGVPGNTNAVAASATAAVAKTSIDRALPPLGTDSASLQPRTAKTEELALIQLWQMLQPLKTAPPPPPTPQPAPSPLAASSGSKPNGATPAFSIGAVTSSGGLQPHHKVFDGM